MQRVQLCGAAMRGRATLHSLPLHAPGPLPLADLPCPRLAVAAGDLKAPRIMDWLKQLAQGIEASGRQEAVGGEADGGAGAQGKAGEGESKESKESKKAGGKKEEQSVAEIPQARAAGPAGPAGRHALHRRTCAGCWVQGSGRAAVPSPRVRAWAPTLPAPSLPPPQVVANVSAAELARRLEKEGVVIVSFFAGAWTGVVNAAG